MEVLGILVVALMGICGCVLALGWIIPLVIGFSWRKKQRPGHKTWLIFAGVWGSLVVIGMIGVGLLGIAIYKVSTSEYGYGQAPKVTFNPATFNGPTASVRVPGTYESHLVATVSSGKVTTFATSNGVFVVPAGTISPIELRISTVDQKNRKWTATTRGPSCDDNSKITLAANMTTNLQIGPPYCAAVEVTCSAVSDTIRLSPTYGDHKGNSTTFSSSGIPVSPPEFQFVDKDNNVVWKGKFEAG